MKSQADLATRINEFADARWERLLPDVLLTSESNRLHSDQGGCQLIVCPIFEQTFTYRFDLSKVLNANPHYMNFTRQSAASATPQLDGLEYRYPDLPKGTFLGFVKLYRHGAVEIADGYVMNFRQGRPLPGTLLMKSLLDSLAAAVETSHRITGAQLYWIDFRILSRPGEALAFFNNTSSYGKTDRSDLIFDPVQIQYEENLKGRMPYLARSLLDQVWQAFGYVNCGYFDQNDNYSCPN